MGKYVNLILHATNEDAVRIMPVLEEAVKEQGLFDEVINWDYVGKGVPTSFRSLVSEQPVPSGRVAFFHFLNTFVDYGINPIEDGNLMPYFEVQVDGKAVYGGVCCGGFDRFVVCRDMKISEDTKYLSKYVVGLVKDSLV